MSVELRRGLSAFGAGVLFAVGLVLSGMSDPRNVAGFLDVFGDWNPRLLFVMGGAIAVHAPVYRWVRRLPTPWLGARFVIPTRRALEAKLVIGAGVFGIGWGIAGYCPGPALVALPSGQLSVVVFVGAMAVGIWIPRALERNRVPPSASEPERSAPV